jgi:hypothetical protein
MQRHFQETATGRFDANIMGERIYEHPFEVLATRDPRRRGPIQSRWAGIGTGAASASTSAPATGKWRR